jgi:hypothetical protein
MTTTTMQDATGTKEIAVVPVTITIIVWSVNAWTATMPRLGMTVWTLSNMTAKIRIIKEMDTVMMAIIWGGVIGTAVIAVVAVRKQPTAPNVYA